MKPTLNLPEPALEVEIFLPKKALYHARLNEILLEGLKLNFKDYFNNFREEIVTFLEKYKMLADDFRQMEVMGDLFNGYSISDVDGVFKGNDGSVSEESTQVVRIIFKPDYRKVYDEWRIKNKIPFEEFLQLAGTVLTQNNFVALQEDSPAGNIVRQWMNSVAAFVFGYLVRELTLMTGGKEEEIWVTINHHYSVARVSKN